MTTNMNGQQDNTLLCTNLLPQSTYFTPSHLRSMSSVSKLNNQTNHIQQNGILSIEGKLGNLIFKNLDMGSKYTLHAQKQLNCTCVSWSHKRGSNSKSVLLTIHSPISSFTNIQSCYSSSSMQSILPPLHLLQIIPDCLVSFCFSESKIPLA